MSPAVAVLFAGALAQAATWRVVARGRLNVWTGVVPVLAVSGAAALPTGWVSLAPDVSWPASLGTGLGAGLALYGATSLFVRVAARWGPFRRAAGSIYDQRRGLALPAALALSLLLAVPGEELFWRGLFQARAAGAAGDLGGALLAWAAYVGMNAASGELAILLGSVVGGATWGALALWTGGVLAPLACHAVWTAGMLAVPPVSPVPGRTR